MNDENQMGFNPWGMDFGDLGEPVKKKTSPPAPQPSPEPEAEALPEIPNFFGGFGDLGEPVKKAEPKPESKPEPEPTPEPEAEALPEIPNFFGGFGDLGEPVKKAEPNPEPKPEPEPSLEPEAEALPEIPNFFGVFGDLGEPVKKAEPKPEPKPEPEPTPEPEAAAMDECTGTEDVQEEPAVGFDTPFAAETEEAPASPALPDAPDEADLALFDAAETEEPVGEEASVWDDAVMEPCYDSDEITAALPDKDPYCRLTVPAVSEDALWKAECRSAMPADGEAMLESVLQWMQGSEKVFHYPRIPLGDRGWSVEEILKHPAVRSEITRSGAKLWEETIRQSETGTAPDWIRLAWNRKMMQHAVDYFMICMR